MFAARLLVGLGEAALAPCAVTMIGDLFPPSRRGPPMALYVLGSMVAVGIGSAATGSILKLAPLGAFDAVPLLRGLAPWRTAFIVLGTSGALIALLVALLEEPARKGVALEARNGLGLRQTFIYFAENWKVLLPFYGAVATYGIGSALAMGWGPAVLIRTYGLTAGALGQSLGADQFFAAMGAICAALVIDPVVRRAGTAGKLYLGALLSLLAIPSTIAYAANSIWLATAMTAEVMFVSAIYGSTMLSTMTELVPTNMKGISVSLYAFVLIMIGSTLGPLIAAQVNQGLFHDPKMIGHAIALVGISALVMSAALTLAARWRFTKALACNGTFARVLNTNLQ
jgi:MFS family permease